MMIVWGLEGSRWMVGLGGLGGVANLPRNKVEASPRLG